MNSITSEVCKAVSGDFTNCKSFGRMGEVAHTQFEKIRMARNPKRIICVKGKEIEVVYKKA